MQISLRRVLLGIVLILPTGLLFQCKGVRPGHDPLWPENVPERISFTRDIKPLLEVQCVQCHNSEDAHRYAGLNLETRPLAMTTGRQIPSIRPGDPENSPLIQVLKFDDSHPMSMPPAPDKIWGVRLEILEKWIRDGAEWPDGERLVPPQDWQ